MEKTRGTAADLPNEHFVDENTERPPINGLVVTFALDDFWGQVFWSATERPGSTVPDKDRKLDPEKQIKP